MNVVVLLQVYSTEQKMWTTMGSRNMGMCTMSESSHIDSIARVGDEILLMGILSNHL